MWRTTLRMAAGRQLWASLLARRHAPHRRLRSRWGHQKLGQIMDDIAKAHIPYNAITRNSNTVAREALVRAGFEPPVGPTIGPLPQAWNNRLPPF